MLVIVFWLVIFILGADYIFTEGLTIIPDILIGNIGSSFGLFFIFAITSFFVWCFAED